MSDALVPVALSSEIDMAGNERIHVAGYTPIVRPVWSYTPASTFLILNDGGEVAKSTDGGETWQVVDIGPVYPTDPNFRGNKVNYSNGVWFITARTPQKILRSTDLVNWTTVVLDPQPVAAGVSEVFYAMGRHYVSNSGARYYQSTDAGMSWSEGFMSGLANDGSECGVGTATHAVMGSNSRDVWAATAFDTWTKRTVPVATGADIRSVIHNGSVYIACAAINAGVAANRIVTSVNGQAWTSIYAPNVDVYGIAQGTGSYVIIANGAVIRRTTNLTSWSANIANPFTNSLNEIVYGDGTYVAVANGGEVAVSHDEGLTWALKSHPLTSGFHIKSVAFGVL